MAVLDLVITKTDTPDPIYIGQNLTYIVTATNNGATVNDGIVDISDLLPINLFPVSATSLDGSVSLLGNQVDLSIPALAFLPGQSKVLTIVATISHLHSMPPMVRVK